MGERPTVFISHSPDDAAVKDELLKHFSVLEKFRGVELWREDRILAGSRAEAVIIRTLNDVDVVVLLLSESWLKMLLGDVELQKCLERRAEENRSLIPLILEDCDWRSVPVLGNLQALPRGGQTLARTQDRDDAFRTVVGEVAAVLSEHKKNGSYIRMAIAIASITLMVTLVVIALKPKLPVAIIIVGLGVLSGIGIVVHNVKYIKRLSAAVATVVGGVAAASTIAGAGSMMLVGGISIATTTIKSILIAMIAVAGGFFAGTGTAAAVHGVGVSSGSSSDAKEPARADGSISNTAGDSMSPPTPHNLDASIGDSAIDEAGAILNDASAESYPINRHERSKAMVFDAGAALKSAIAPASDPPLETGMTSQPWECVVGEKLGPGSFLVNARWTTLQPSADFEYCRGRLKECCQATTSSGCAAKLRNRINPDNIVFRDHCNK